MKVKKVNRYSCDFCKKKTLTAHSMRNHEEHCTKNPNRKCGMCAYVGESQPDLKELIAIVPDYHKYPDDFLDELIAAVAKALPALREAANNCPACIMAAIRQSNIPLPIVTDFDFEKESKEMLAECNQRSEQGYGYGGY